MFFTGKLKLIVLSVDRLLFILFALATL